MSGRGGLNLGKPRPVGVVDQLEQGPSDVFAMGLACDELRNGMPGFSPPDEIIWEALRRESALVAEHLGIGATAIGKADFERTASYAQAFFALSVGFERGAKLALTLDAALGSSGKFLDSKALRGYGHKLDRLLKRVDAVAARRGFRARMPDTEIHRAIVASLTKFATNVSRYYNLESLTPGAATGEDPIAAWYTDVTRPVVEAHYTPTQRARDDDRATAIATPASTLVFVLATAETGEPITELRDVMIRGAEAKVARQWERMYVLQLARFVTSIVSGLGELAQAAGLPVPFLHEYFSMFRQDDRDFRTRKTWSIHG